MSIEVRPVRNRTRFRDRSCGQTGSGHDLEAAGEQGLQAELSSPKKRVQPAFWIVKSGECSHQMVRLGKCDQRFGTVILGAVREVP